MLLGNLELLLYVYMRVAWIQLQSIFEVGSGSIKVSQWTIRSA